MGEVRPIDHGIHNKRWGEEAYFLSRDIATCFQSISLRRDG